MGSTSKHTPRRSYASFSRVSFLVRSVLVAALALTSVLSGAAVCCPSEGSSGWAASSDSAGPLAFFPSGACSRSWWRPEVLAPGRSTFSSASIALRRCSLKLLFSCFWPRIVSDLPRLCLRYWKDTCRSCDEDGQNCVLSSAPRRRPSRRCRRNNALPLAIPAAASHGLQSSYRGSQIGSLQWEPRQSLALEAPRVWSA